MSAPETYTPGPWVWTGDNLASEAPDLDDGFYHSVIEFNPGSGYSDDSWDYAELRIAAPNARLIAASPDLLVAGQAWVSWIDTKGTSSEVDAAIETALLADLRGAIAKATGEASE